MREARARQVVVLSEGVQLHGAGPRGAVAWLVTCTLKTLPEFRTRQVVVLSEGVQLYGADPRGAVAWFGGALHYPYDAAVDGAPSDWLMDLVSVSFAKPNGFAPRRACIHAGTNAP